MDLPYRQSLCLNLTARLLSGYTSFRMDLLAFPTLVECFLSRTAARRNGHVTWVQTALLQPTRNEEKKQPIYYNNTRSTQDSM